LLVDDFAEWRAKVRALVDHLAHIVGEACDGLEAVEKVIKLRPDIVILDLGMPRMNGIDAARRIRQESCSTAIVFLTENTDNDIKQEALCVGHAYVLKRDAHAQLLPAIKSAQAVAASDRE